MANKKIKDFKKRITTLMDDLNNYADKNMDTTASHLAILLDMIVVCCNRGQVQDLLAHVGPWLVENGFFDLENNDDWADVEEWVNSIEDWLNEEEE